jgi:hypothetical protein
MVPLSNGVRLSCGAVFGCSQIEDYHGQTAPPAFKRLLAGDKAIVFGVRADPEPEHTVGNVHREHAIARADAGRIDRRMRLK